jgi:hypothetical protein
MTSLLERRLAVPWPKRMRTLERDPRGYPVPFIVLRDRYGVHQFTINDTRKVGEATSKRLCSISGKRLETSVWFAGGSRCFLHPLGAFIDPPMHYECGEYALRVCPFLAARSYARRIDDAKLADGGLPEGMGLIRAKFMQPRLPERFGYGCTSDYAPHKSDFQGGVFTVHDWEYVEFWRSGEMCEPPETGKPSPDEPFAT